MIDLAEYAPWVMKFIKQRQLACVYVISYQDGRPSKIGYAQDISTRFSTIQMSNVHQLSIEHILWTPSFQVAKIIEQSAQLQLHNLRIRGEWFDVHAEIAVKVIQEAASRNKFHDDTLIEHRELMHKLAVAGFKRKLDRRRRATSAPPEGDTTPPRGSLEKVDA